MKPSLQIWCGVVLSLCVFANVANAQSTNFTILHEFGFPRQQGEFPVGVLTEAKDGFLYGVTVYGSVLSEYAGVLYKVKPDGSGYQVVHHFGPHDQDGNLPQGGVIEGHDGRFYGTTEYDGEGGAALVYRVNKDGSDFALLHRFSEYDRPMGLLTEGGDGTLFGRLRNNSCFKLNPDGTGYSEPAALDGANALIGASDGALYGTAAYAGTNGAGRVFRVSNQAAGLQVLHQFQGGTSDGASPQERLLEGTDGWLYGTTELGGAFGRGIVFKLRKDGTGYLVLHSFGGEPGMPQQPWGVLKEDQGGMLQGLTINGEPTRHGTQFRLNRDGSGFVTAREFDIPDRLLWAPSEPLLMASDGLLYGTTRWGGPNTNDLAAGVGMLYRVLAGGSTEMVRAFHDYYGGDGIFPQALMEGSDGKLYISTEADFNEGNYQGRLVRCNRDGANYSVLRTFNPSDGVPYSSGRSLIEGSDGLLYGINADDAYNFAVRIGKDGTGFTMLHHFSTVDEDGFYSFGFMEASDHLLYGTTDGTAAMGRSEIYRVNKITGQFETLHVFEPTYSVRGGPVPIEGADGRLYGTTLNYTQHGGIFSMNKDGSGYTELHRFANATNDGGEAFGSLLEGSDGRLYGTTYSGGQSNFGTVFGLDKNGSNYVVLHHFTGSPADGAKALDGLVEGKDGLLYGSTSAAGTPIFRLNKDGSNYRILIRGTGAHKLVLGRDGAFFGLGSSPTALWGSLFRYGHALSMSRTAGGTHLELTGIPGYTYELQRSSDLTRWTTLRSVVMSEGLSVAYDDADGPPTAAFYRVRVP